MEGHVAALTQLAAQEREVFSHCLSLAFHWPFAAFYWPFSTAFYWPFAAFLLAFHCRFLAFHCRLLAFRCLSLTFPAVFDTPGDNVPGCAGHR